MVNLLERVQAAQSLSKPVSQGHDAPISHFFYMAKIHMAPEKRKDVFQLLLHVVDTFVEQLRLSQYR